MPPAAKKESTFSSALKIAGAVVGLLVTLSGALWGLETHFVNNEDFKQMMEAQMNDKILELQMDIDSTNMTPDARLAIKKFRLEQLKKALKQMEHN